MLAEGTGALPVTRRHPARRYLPFGAGHLSCGAGIQLKMALTRWSDWASDVGLRDLTGTRCALLEHRVQAIHQLHAECSPGCCFNLAPSYRWCY